MWQDTSTSLMEIYTQTLQEARQNPKPDTHSQGMPLDLSIEHVIKTQLDNTDAIIMMGDAEAHPRMPSKRSSTYAGVNAFRWLRE